MFCSTCGRETSDEARYCENCGAVLDQQAGGPSYAPGMPPQDQPRYGERIDVPNYLVQAILVTIFCCLPAGIVAIVFAAQVNGRVRSGDLADAQRLSGNARTWCWISFGVGLAIGLLYFLVIIFSVIAGLGGAFQSSGL
ncbi:MAG: zinc-ribbon domain-containing protein [Chloroflexi bacterium]|nr:zinc-ribbon domain-containing protein [Chloroflexota bacterium]